MLFDLAYLRITTDGDTELEEQLIELFKNTSERCIKKLEESPQADWAASLHEMRGAALAMGAITFAEYCKHGETNSVFGSLSSQEYLLQLHDLLQDTLVEMKQRIVL